MHFYSTPRATVLTMPSLIKRLVALRTRAAMRIATVGIDAIARLRSALRGGR
jgi:hypothetical protein